MTLFCSTIGAKHLCHRAAIVLKKKKNEVFKQFVTDGSADWIWFRKLESQRRSLTRLQCRDAQRGKKIRKERQKLPVQRRQRS